MTSRDELDEASSPETPCPRTILNGFFSVWSEYYDLDKALTYLHPDCRYCLSVDEDLLPFAGETIGREAIGVQMALMREQFEYVLFRPRLPFDDGETVRQQVEFRYRHRASGETITGTFRFVWTIQDGLITSCEEFHDRARIEAFVRLFAHGTD